MTLNSKGPMIRINNACILLIILVITYTPKVKANTGDVLNRSDLVLTFSEEFHEGFYPNNISNNKKHWKTNYDFGQQSGSSSRTLYGELEIYSDRAYNGVDPFIARDGSLTIVAARNSDQNRSINAGKPFTSGLITTSDWFEQRYGYFEMRAMLPRGAGLWPAFWLLARSNAAKRGPQFPGEIDIMEQLGRRPNRIYCSAHWPKDATLDSENHVTLEVDAGKTSLPHSYGLLWTSQKLTWFIDDLEVATMSNPGLHQPMRILANLAVGGKWGGPPDDTTHFPAEMIIYYIKAYSLKN